MDAIKLRQYSAATEVTQSLLDAFKVIGGLLSLQPMACARCRTRVLQHSQFEVSGHSAIVVGIMLLIAVALQYIRAYLATSFVDVTEHTLYESHIFLLALRERVHFVRAACW